MDSLTVFSDIHANLPALEAVIQDVEARGLGNLYCLGDLVGYGTFPNQVIDVICGRSIPTVMGNYDLGVGNSCDDCGCNYKTDLERQRGELSIAWTNRYTTAERKAFLRSLPTCIPMQIGEMEVLLVHGSPRKVNEPVFEDRPDAYCEQLLDASGVDIIVCGHTHVPYHKALPFGRHVINAGSVGKPADHDPRACYVMLTASGRDLKVSFCRIPYDVERAARSIEMTAEVDGMPYAFAQMLRDGAA